MAGGDGPARPGSVYQGNRCRKNQGRQCLRPVVGIAAALGHHEACAEDWSPYQVLSLWIYADKANGQILNFWVYSDSEGQPRGRSTFFTSSQWTGRDGSRSFCRCRSSTLCAIPGLGQGHGLHDLRQGRRRHSAGGQRALDRRSQAGVPVISLLRVGAAVVAACMLPTSGLYAADVLKTREDGGPGVYTDGKAAGSPAASVDKLTFPSARRRASPPLAAECAGSGCWRSFRRWTQAHPGDPPDDSLFAGTLPADRPGAGL